MLPIDTTIAPLEQSLVYLEQIAYNSALTNAILLFFVACSSGLVVLMVLFSFLKRFY